MILSNHHEIVLQYIAQNNYAMCSVHMHGYVISTRLFLI
jgi:hypothetical protein